MGSGCGGKKKSSIGKRSKNGLPAEESASDEDDDEDDIHHQQWSTSCSRTSSSSPLPPLPTPRLSILVLLAAFG